MGVQLNIKSSEARELAETIAKATGSSLTDAVLDALRQRARDVTLHDRRERLTNLLRGTRALWTPELLEGNHKDWLYDDDGLPK